MDRASVAGMVCIAVGGMVLLSAGACGDDDCLTRATCDSPGPTGQGGSGAGAGGTGGAGPSSTATTSAGGIGGATSAGGMGGATTSAGGMGGGMMAPNQFTNPGFELFSAGANPPFEPPDAWVAFGLATDGPTAIPYVQYATQAHATPIFNPGDPGDTSSLFPGYMNSRALKVFGATSGDGSGAFQRSLGTLYQEFDATGLPVGADLTLSGWAFHSSVDPLGPESRVYLVIKCFNADFTEQLCGVGGTKSALITGASAFDAWNAFSATVTNLDAQTVVIQAGVEFEQCVGGTPCTGAEGAGSIYWDQLYFSWE